MSEESVYRAGCGCSYDDMTGFTVKPCHEHKTPHERLIEAARAVLLDPLHDWPDLRAAVAGCDAPPTNNQEDGDALPTDRRSG